MKLKNHSNKIAAGVIGALLVGTGVAATVLTGGLAAIGFLAVGSVTAGALGVVGDVQDYKRKLSREGKQYDLGFIKPLKSLWKKRIEKIRGNSSREGVENQRPSYKSQQIQDLPTFHAPDEEEASKLSEEIEALFEKSQKHRAQLEQAKEKGKAVDSFTLQDSPYQSKFTPLRAAEQKSKKRAGVPSTRKKNLVSRVFSRKKKAR